LFTLTPCFLLPGMLPRNNSQADLILWYLQVRDGYFEKLGTLNVNYGPNLFSSINQVHTSIGDIKFVNIKKRVSHILIVNMLSDGGNLSEYNHNYHYTPTVFY